MAGCGTGGGVSGVAILGFVVFVSVLRDSAEVATLRP